MTNARGESDCRDRRRDYQGGRSQAADRPGSPVSWDLTRIRQGKAALIVTEAATNLIKHAGGGELIVQGLDHEQLGPGLEILALDSGRGMSDVGQCVADGYSTAGSPGTGLGAIGRLADSFEIYSDAGHGHGPVGSTQSNTSATRRACSAQLELGVVGLPAPGEQVCGDAWAVDRTRGPQLRHDGRRAGSRAAGCAGGRRGRARLRRPLRPGTGARSSSRLTQPSAARGVQPWRSLGWTRLAARSDTPAWGISPASSSIREPARPRAWSRKTAPSGTRFARSRCTTIRGPKIRCCSCTPTAWPRTGAWIATPACARGIRASSPVSFTGITRRGRDDVTVLVARQREGGTVMNMPLLNLEVRVELDIVLARQRARQIAGLTGLCPARPDANRHRDLGDRPQHRAVCRRRDESNFSSRPAQHRSC